MKILSFGHIPSVVGGRQSSGLANVIYQLSLNISKEKGIDLTLAATDVFAPVKNINGLRVLGWTMKVLFTHLLHHPYTCIRLITITLNNKRKYSPLVSVPSLFLKSALLDYAVKKERPKIVHLHGALSVLYYPVVPKGCNIIVTLHGNVGNDNNLPNRSTHEKVERACVSSKRIRMLCTISSHIPTILKEMYGNIAPQVKVILNAYDNDVFNYIKPVAHKKVTLCTVASYSKLKGQIRVLDALIECKADYRYVCIGHFQDADKERMENKAQENGVDFEHLGVKKPSEIREVLSGCDYMILPSSSEGFGLVYLEAIACGVPVIIPKNLPLALEGNILNENNAIYLEDCSVKAIADILPILKDKLWDHKDVAETVESYTWSNIAQEYVNMYKSIID